MLGRKTPLGALMMLAALPILGGAAAPGCLLCSPSEGGQNGVQKTAIPLRINVTTKLSFSRLALTGNGSARVAVDPESGARNLDGNIIGLGGYPAAASVTLTGEPGRSVRIDLPTQIKMQSSTGGVILISDIRSTLGPAPRLDATGKLDFSFGGRLEISGNMSGSFRGRIPITANYE
ncbi:MAG: DUF4402 domain-containing protein [Sphingorhabdus sp.]